MTPQQIQADPEILSEIREDAEPATLTRKEVYAAPVPAAEPASTKTRPSASNWRNVLGLNLGSGEVPPVASAREKAAAAWLRKAQLAMIGEWGAALVSAAALLLTTQLIRFEAILAYQAIGAVLVIRALRAFGQRRHNVLGVPLVRTQTKRIVTDEAQIFVAFAAVGFLLSWPLWLAGAATFFGLNLAAQLALGFVASKTSCRVARRLKDTDSARLERQVIIAGTSAHALKLADKIMNSPELGAELIGFVDYHKSGLWRYHDVPLLGHPDVIEEIVAEKQVDAVFLAVEPEDIADSLLLFRKAERMGVDIYFLPDVFRAEFARSRVVRLNGTQAVLYSGVPQADASTVLKTAVDWLGALVGVVIIAPILLAVSVAIKVDSRGPVFFKQVRSGLNGRRFQLYKFRTMVTDAERKKAQLMSRNEMSGPVFKIKDDPRITRVGKFLRKYSIDELPQLFNVLKGDMSLVGPRPPLPSEVAKFEPWQHRKLSVKPGLTCLWQVGGRNAIDFEDWMRLDLQYIDNWSIALDAKILAKTVPTVLKGSGS